MRPRIVSLLPSATELICALGMREALVGRSHECDFPLGVETVPVCTAPKIDPTGNSERIHATVQQHLRAAISVYNVDGDLLSALAPTHVVTQVQCEVCAVSLGEVRRVLSEWVGPPPEVIPLRAGGLEDVFDDFARVATALGIADAGTALIHSCRERVEAIATKARSSRRRPRVATIEWLSPLMAAGNWIPELVGLAGGRNLFGSAAHHSPWLEWKELAASDADVIILFPCGFAMEECRRDLHFLTSCQGWNELRAVREGWVFLADGKQFFNRPGPRIVESLEILAEILHPDRFDFGHRGVAWDSIQ